MVYTYISRLNNCDGVDEQEETHIPFESFRQHPPPMRGVMGESRGRVRGRSQERHAALRMRADNHPNVVHEKKN